MISVRDRGSHAERLRFKGRRRVLRIMKAFLRSLLNRFFGLLAETKRLTDQIAFVDEGLENFICSPRPNERIRFFRHS